jgi:hypothetical protein
VGPKGDWKFWKEKNLFSFSWNRIYASDRPPGEPVIILDYPTPAITAFLYRNFRLQSKSHFGPHSCTNGIKSNSKELNLQLEDQFPYPHFNENLNIPS